MRVVDAVSPDIEFIPCEAGEEWWKEYGGNSLIPDETCYGRLTRVSSDQPRRPESLVRQGALQ